MCRGPALPGPALRMTLCEESDGVTETILSGAARRRHYAAVWRRALLDHGPAACPYAVPSSAVRQLARRGLICRAGGDRTSDRWRTAWRIVGRPAALDLLDHLTRPPTPTLYPE